MAHNLYKKGFVQIYTGCGKGKTTAAIGLAIRAAGAGMKVFFGQFLKSRRCTEHEVFDKIPNITHIFFGTGNFLVAPSQADYIAAGSGAETCIKALQKFDVCIFDELNIAFHKNLVDSGMFIAALKNKPEQVEVIITGRNAPAGLLEIADLITEMVEKKHYYKKGVPARRGIEE